MTHRKYMLYFLVFLTIKTTSAQQLSSERLDTTISIFWNQNLKVQIKIIDPEEQDDKKKNTLVSLFSENEGSKTILFQDSLYAYTISFKMMDLDGDGIQDLLIYYSNNGSENRSYHLYLVDQKKERLIRVKEFEKVFNPYYDKSQCVILGFESFQRNLILHHYLIDKRGKLFQTNWR